MATGCHSRGRSGFMRGADTLRHSLPAGQRSAIPMVVHVGLGPESAHTRPVASGEFQFSFRILPAIGKYRDSAKLLLHWCSPMIEPDSESI